jgi:hypothetical protein
MPRRERSAVPDLLDVTRKGIADRLKELKPLVDEYNRLQAAGKALGGLPSSSSSDARKATTRRRSLGRPRGSRGAVGARVTAKPARKPAGRPKGKAGRRKGSGGRAAEAHALVKAQPGITIPELAAKMGIKQNYLYRVLPGLQKEGKVTKQGRGWHPKKS